MDIPPLPVGDGQENGHHHGGEQLQGEVSEHLVQQYLTDEEDRKLAQLAKQKGARVCLVTNNAVSPLTALGAVALLATNMRINDIAERVGYRNRKSFLVNFRSYTGLTPSEYRQKYCMGGES